MSATQLKLGLDIGGTKIEACLLETKQGSYSYKILDRQRASTPRDSLETWVEQTALLIEKITQGKVSSLSSIGLGAPGSIHPRTHRVLNSSMDILKNADLCKLLGQRLNFSGDMAIENDANCFALAEAYFGAGRTWAEKNNVPALELVLVGVTLGTGVGGGLMVNGKLIRGRRGGAAEIGHTTLVDAGRKCYCGKHGCVEQYLSGTALEAFYASRASALHPIKGQEIFNNAAQGDPLALSTLEIYRDHLVTFLSDVANFIDPHVIVLGGGVSSQKVIYDNISERLSKGCFLTDDPPAVLENELGGTAGVIGAAFLTNFGLG